MNTLHSLFEESLSEDVKRFILLWHFNYKNRYPLHYSLARKKLYYTDHGYLKPISLTVIKLWLFNYAHTKIDDPFDPSMVSFI